MTKAKKKTVKKPAEAEKRAHRPDGDGGRGGSEGQHYDDRRYRSLISHIPDAIWTTDEDCRLVFISQNSKVVTGYTQEEEYEIARREVWFGRIHPDDVDRARAAYNALIREAQPYDIEYRFRKKDGSWVWLNDRALATYKKNGMSYADGVLTDITERKHAVAEIERLKEKYESLIRHIPVVVVSCLPDETATILFISDRYKDWTGYSPEDFYNDPGLWLKTVHPDDWAKASGVWMEACRNKAEYNDEYRVIHKDTGQVRWVKDSGIPIKDENGDVVMYDGSITDITERKQVEAEIQKLKEQYESLIRNIPCAIDSCLPDETATMIFISDRYKDWTGYSPEDFYRDPGLWPKSVHPDDRARATKAWFAACRNKTEYNDEYRVMHKDTGQVRWVKDHGVPVRDEAGNIILYDGTITDITDRKEMEQALAESREDLQHYIGEVTRAQEYERKRISRELHDETVQSLADLCTDVDAIRMKGELSEGAAQKLGQLRLKIQGVMNEVRRFSHELRPGLLDYFGLVRSLESLAQEWRQEGKLNFHVEVAGDEQRLSNEAELLLFRIIQEALRNARKHADATEATVRVEFSDKKVKLTVADNGSGFEVPKELGSFTRRGKLGLMGMKERANLLGGSLHLRSKPGEGTTVAVEIPVDINRKPK